MTAAKKPKPLYMIWNEDLEETATNNFFDTVNQAKKEAERLNEDYSYCIYECRLVAGAVGRQIIWKSPS